VLDSGRYHIIRWNVGFFIVEALYLPRASARSSLAYVSSATKENQRITFIIRPRGLGGPYGSV